MKIAIINDIHFGKPLERNGKQRAASHLVEDKLQFHLQQIMHLHSPDLLVHLGDLIRSEEKELDQSRYLKALRFFKDLPCPVIHLIGNHELKRMTEDDVKKMWKSEGFDQESYGYKETESLTIVWLGLEIDPKDPLALLLPQKQLSWLKETLKNCQKPAIIFTHVPIDNQNISGNYFYEISFKDIRCTYLDNQESIRKILSESGKAIAVIQAHLHYFHAKVIDGIPYITCPAMGDNICGPTTQDHLPEIYSVLNFNPQKMTLKAYSREFCFAGYET